jgi:GntR family transcriptional regulator
MFSLHPGSGIPIYRQLVDQVRRLIAGGQLPPGAELPSVRDLAVEYAVNPMTISKAYSLLEAQGLLERHRGKPMTVAAGRRAQASLTQRLKQIEPQVRQLALSARQLELTPKDLAALIDRNWEHDDE